MTKEKILSLISKGEGIPRSMQEIQEFIKIKDRKYFREAVLNPMIKLNLIEPADKDKPNSPKQKYIAKDKNV